MSSLAFGGRLHEYHPKTNDRATVSVKAGFFDRPRLPGRIAHPTLIR